MRPTTSPDPAPYQAAILYWLMSILLLGGAVDLVWLIAEALP